MQDYLLSILIFTPLFAALVALFIPSSSHQIFRGVTILAGIVQVIALIPVMVGFKPGSLQFAEQQPWITIELGSWGTLKAEYFVAIDGLNILFVCLTVFIMLIAALASWTITK